MSSPGLSPVSVLVSPAPADRAKSMTRRRSLVSRPSRDGGHLSVPGTADELSLHRMHSNLKVHQKPQAQLRVARQSRIDKLRQDVVKLLGGTALSSFRRSAAIATAAVALAGIVLAPVSFFAGFPAALSGIIAAGLFGGIILGGLLLQIVSRWRHLHNVSPEIKEHLMAMAQELEDLSHPGAYEEDARNRRREASTYIASLSESERYAAQLVLLPQYHAANHSMDVEADKKQHKQVIDLINALHGGFGWHVAEFFLGIADVGTELRETINATQKKWGRNHTQKRRVSMGLNEASSND